MTSTNCPRSSGRGLGAGRTRSFGTSRTARRTRWNCGRFYDAVVVVVGRPRLWKKTRATTETTTTPTTRRRRPSRFRSRAIKHTPVGKIFSSRDFFVWTTTTTTTKEKRNTVTRALNCVRECKDMYYGFDARVMREEQLSLDDDDDTILFLLFLVVVVVLLPDALVIQVDVLQRGFIPRPILPHDARL